MTRKWAYRAIRQGWPEFSQWLDAVIQRVEMYNASLPVPLSPPECRAIGKSIAKYTHRNFTPETFAQYVLIVKIGVAKTGVTIDPFSKRTHNIGW